MVPYPVLLVCQELTQGGSERQLTEIARSLDRARFAPHVACLRPNGIRYDELRAAGVPVVTFPVNSFAKPIVLLRAAMKMGSYLRHHRIRLVHSFDTPANIFAVPVARAFRVPIVLSSQRASRELVAKPYRRLLRITDHLVDGIVVNCRALEKHLLISEGVDRSLIHLCYNGIDTSVFFPRQQPRQAPLRDASVVIGVVCALRPEKGLTTLLQAFSRIVRPGVSLAVVGSGPMLPTLESLCCELGLVDSCVFIPSTGDVVPWLRSMDIFVLPSLSEALSNALMEAMACGCAVVASGVGGNPELVTHGETGLLFEPSDVAGLASALRTLVDQSCLRQRIAAAAADFIRMRFSRQTAAGAMGAIYNSFLQS